ncbi:16S rRNA (uracil(1498)-N(3))-methyltransferase [Serpentinicella sp. ANB-PHB4]|uniref:16S rRNA (uracil(1498)-N(3))-methyltransferase n=1 Tax=Serpentinicella sp. ANB-PHB4 TaxID=3074076 RepID=UPI002857704E|nr:16S rRNA (uracil(1498)-N(3))-methyltransferase [Serpentinicella sp. ANB-PHB4]MDR5657973.1 16S rRNA (uracil(1498)-N(3))-methyltransferase [Serpentinicella sp. ANB-PHB4]
MNRFFVPINQVNDEEKVIKILNEDVHHISKVLRLSNGDLIEVSDGQKNVYYGKIISITKEEVLVEIAKHESLNTEPRVNITLFQSVPKSTKMDWITQKATELGVNKIVPVITKRTVVNFKTDKDKEKKKQRWTKIVTEAAKQSKRGKIPDVDMPISFHHSIEMSKNYDLNILAYENEKQIGIKKLLRDINNEEIINIGVWIGPEGGFDHSEIQMIEDKNIEMITLGPRILRTETAGAVLISTIMYELGDLGGY